MTRWALFTLLLAGVALASPMQTVVPQQRRLGNRVVLLVDCSGSMAPRVGRALAAVQTITEQPLDGWEVAFLRFGDRVERFPAEGWLRLSDADALGEAQVWLRDQGAHGNTYVIPALLAALAEDGADAVLVTDGVFQHETPEAVVAAWPEDGPVLVVLGVGGGQDVLRELGELGGGYYRDDPGPPVLPAQGQAAPR